MINKPNQSELQKIPNLYATDGTSAKDKTIYMKFFIGGCTWYVAEYCELEKLFFGFVNLNDPQCAEWGYFSFAELESLNVKGFQIDRDLYFKPIKASEIQEIIDCNGI